MGFWMALAGDQGWDFAKGAVASGSRGDPRPPRPIRRKPD
jgi:hypothetical protein